MPSKLVETFGNMDKVLPFLWIGDRFSAVDKKSLEKFDIREILTVCSYSIQDEQKSQNIKYHHVPLDDSPSQNILLCLEEMLHILQESIQAEKNILVHCEAGVSRSAAVCCAYVMKTKSLSMKKGLDCVKSARFFACPNEGFMKQLQIFEQLSWSACLDTLNNSQIYRSWLLESGNHPTTEEEAKSSLFIQTLKSDSKDLARYRCIACRTDLFYDCHIQQHMNRAEKDCKFGFLIDPLNWMELGQYEGKILCPKCSSKLGSYCWGGRECQGFDGEKCGAKVRPWFFIGREKVRLPMPSQPLPALQNQTSDIKE